MSTDWVPLGRVARAHGVRGELRVTPFVEDANIPDRLQQVRLRSSKNGTSEVFKIIGLRAIHRAYLLSLQGLDAREPAMEWVGAEVDIEAGALPESDDSFYLYELVGARLQNPAGQSLGTVREVVDNAGQDLLIIDSAAGERMLPLVDDTYVSFDSTARVLVVQPIPGLWDDG